VDGGDSRLQRVRTGSTLKPFFHERQCFRNLPMVPETPVLIFEHDKLSGLVKAGLAPRVVKQHQGQESCGLGRWNWCHHGSYEASQPDGLSAKVTTNQGTTPSCGVAFVKDQVDHGQYDVEALGHVAGSGTTYGIPAVRILRFARTSRWAIVGVGIRKGAGDFVRFQTAQRAKRERNLTLGSECRMATGEDQPEISCNQAPRWLGISGPPTSPQQP
jgi:hypothetical protein